MCGENMRVLRTAFHGLGTIPACAGKTVTHNRTSNRRGDHPRVCGENAFSTSSGDFPYGPSPRVRGKLEHPEKHLFRIGTIPACAGKTCGLASVDWRAGDHPRVCGENLKSLPRTVKVPDHPRVCGENLCALLSQLFCAGPSPRVRGKHLLGYDFGVDVRTIPACAGKTLNNQWKCWVQVLFYITLVFSFGLPVAWRQTTNRTLGSLLRSLWDDA